MKKPSLSFVGLGYVGLVSAVCFASKEFKVMGLDIDTKKVELLKHAQSPIFEPELDELIVRTIRNGFFKAITDYGESIANTDITFITVGTPSKPDGSISLDYLRDAVRDVGKALAEKRKYHLLVVKSTVVPGTTENVVKPLFEKHSGKTFGAQFGLCTNPEFLKEGSAVRDTMHPDRIIIGEHDKKSGNVLQSLFKSFHGNEAPPILRTTLPTAELIKYANNSFLATKISFINQMANICQKTPNTDVTIIAKGIGLDERINPRFLNAGLGYGGSCFPKDVKALVAYSKNISYSPNLLEAVEEINLNQPFKALELAKELIGDLKNKRIAILGLAFKPETDDLREAISLKIIEKLVEEEAEVIAYDPAAMPNAKETLSFTVKFAESPIECLKGADCCIIVTEWELFKKLEPDDFINNMRYPAIVDGRRIYDPKTFKKKLKYAAIGLGTKSY